MTSMASALAAASRVASVRQAGRLSPKKTTSGFKTPPHLRQGGTLNPAYAAARTCTQRGGRGGVCHEGNEPTRSSQEERAQKCASNSRLSRSCFARCMKGASAVALHRRSSRYHPFRPTTIGILRRYDTSVRYASASHQARKADLMWVVGTDGTASTRIVTWEHYGRDEAHRADIGATIGAIHRCYYRRHSSVLRIP